jgi:hypothetical protein
MITLQVGRTGTDRQKRGDEPCGLATARLVATVLSSS